jgi:hypothetical protein
MKFFYLYFSLLLCTPSLFTTEKITTEKKTEQKKELEENLLKVATASVLGLGTNYILSYMSSYAHEHGHGIASGGKYTSTIIPTGDIFAPWMGKTEMSYPSNLLFTILAGPLAGVSATYAQGVALKTFNEYMHNKKSLREALYEGLKFPATFFSNAVKTGEKYTSAIMNPQSTNPITNKTITALTIDAVLFLRMKEIVEDSIVGFTPYHRPGFTYDGEIIWNLLLGARAKMFTWGNLAYATLHATMGVPYLIGAAKALYKKFTTPSAQPSQSQQHQSPQTPTAPQVDQNGASDVPQGNG